MFSFYVTTTGLRNQVFQLFCRQVSLVKKCTG